jgi:hypothetical protein
MGQNQFTVVAERGGTETTQARDVRASGGDAGGGTTQGGEGDSTNCPPYPRRRERVRCNYGDDEEDEKCIRHGAIALETKGTAARDPKPVARAASKTSARAASKTPARAANKAPARAANKAPARAANKAPARAANKAPARAASKTPARAANKAPARAANKTLARVGTRMTKNPGTGSTRKQAIVARNKGASAGGRRQSDVRRRDGTGHIDPKYAADLLAQGGTSDRDEDPSGFIAQPRSGDDLAENLAEEFVASATSGENQEEEVLDQEVPEERGGPFVESTAGAEFAWGTDASNPKDAKREPFPTT